MIVVKKEGRWTMIDPYVDLPFLGPDIPTDNSPEWETWNNQVIPESAYFINEFGLASLNIHNEEARAALRSSFTNEPSIPVAAGPSDEIHATAEMGKGPFGFITDVPAITIIEESLSDGAMEVCVISAGLVQLYRKMRTAVQVLIEASEDADILDRYDLHEALEPIREIVNNIDNATFTGAAPGEKERSAAISFAEWVYINASCYSTGKYFLEEGELHTIEELYDLYLESKK